LKNNNGSVASLSARFGSKTITISGGNPRAQIQPEVTIGGAQGKIRVK